MKFYISVNSELMSTLDLKERLEALPTWKENGPTLQTEKSEITLRGMDPTILVAIVGAVGTGFGALISGLLQTIQQSKAKKIIMQSESGSRLEFPADISPEELDTLIEKLKKLDNQTVKIAIP